MKDILLSKVIPYNIVYDGIYVADHNKYNYGILEVSITPEEYDLITTLYRPDKSKLYWEYYIFPIDGLSFNILNDIPEDVDYDPTKLPDTLKNQIEDTINNKIGIENFILSIENIYKEHDMNTKIPNEYLRKYFKENKKFKFMR